MSHSPAMRLLLVLALWAAGIGAAAQFAKIAIIFTELQQHYGQTGVASGFLVSLISLMGIVLGVFAGLLATRVGLRRLLIFGLVLGAAVSFGQSSIPSFPVMLASRFLEGLSHLAIVVTAPTLIAQIALPRHQSASLTLWGTFFGVAFFLVALIAPALTSTLGLPGLFWLHGGYMAVLAVTLAWLLPKPASDTAYVGRLDLPTIIARHRAIYASPHIGAPALGWVFYTLTFVSLLAVLPPFIDPADRLFATAWMPIASILASMTIGVTLLRFMSAVSVTIVGFALAALCAGLLLPLGAHAWLCIALFACLGLVQGASFAAVPQINADADDRALANGGMAQTGNLGNTCGTPILIALTAATGFAGLAVFLIASFLIGIAVHLALARRRTALAGPSE